MKIRAVILILILALTVPFFSSCDKDAASPEENGSNEYEGSFEYNTFAGVVISSGEVKIKKNDDFEVSEIKVSVGDAVKEGDVLFTYDVEKAQIDLEKAKLELEQLENKQTNLIAAKEDLEKDKAEAPADQQLHFSLEIQEKETEILEGEYAIKSKKKEIETRTASIEDTEVKSTVAGTVKSINREGAGGYGQEDAFIVISETGTFRVQGYVNENNVGDIIEGTPVTVRSRVDDSEWNGVVTKIDTEKPEQGNDDQYYYMGYADYGVSVDSSSKYPFYVELENDDGLIMGQHVYILVENGARFSQDFFNGATAPDEEGMSASEVFDEDGVSEEFDSEYGESDND